MARLNRVDIHLPTWPTFERTVTEGLTIEEGESAAFKAGPVHLELPEVLWLDYDEVAKSVGWSLGQFLAFLILRGAISLMPKRTGGLTLEAQLEVKKFHKGDSR